MTPYYEDGQVTIYHGYYRRKRGLTMFGQEDTQPYDTRRSP